MWLFVCLVTTVVATTKDIFVLENQLNISQCDSVVTRARMETVSVLNLSKNPLWKSWDDEFFKIFDNALKLYQAFIGHRLQITKSKEYLLLMRNTSHDSVAPFCDYHPVGMVLFVNSEVAGGEWLFPRQDRSYEPLCGRLVAFPDTFTHPHAIKSVRLGQTWFVFAAFL